MSTQLLLTYSAGLPTVTGTVTLFNSVTAFPPGGSFHLMGLQWFQFAIRTASAASGATGTIVGSYSTDKGTTWLPFYSKATVDAVAVGSPAVADVVEDEVYVGMFKDIRFQYTNAGEVLTVFDPNLSLTDQKATSKVNDGALLVDN
jgi:hypothetical protein